MRGVRCAEGIGLHSGVPCRVELRPSERSGLWLRPLGAAGALRCSVAHAEPGRRATGLGGIRTIEHALSALAGCGVFSAELRMLQGDELPMLDGSALPWAEMVRALATAETFAGDEPAVCLVRRRFVWTRGPARVELRPAREAVIDATIEFAHRLIRRQRRRWAVGDTEAYYRELAPARTFGFVEELPSLREAGLIAGGSLGCAVVFGARGVLNREGLRYADEPVRHKLVDAIGDLALLGAPLQGGLALARWSHADLIEALREALVQGALGFSSG